MGSNIFQSLSTEIFVLRKSKDLGKKSQTSKIWKDFTELHFKPRHF